MCAERYNHEAADQIINHRTMCDREVCDSGHALRDLRRTLSANECKDELNAILLDCLPVAAISEKPINSLWVNELLECSPDSSPLEERADHVNPICLDDQKHGHT